MKRCRFLVFLLYCFSALPSAPGQGGFFLQDGKSSVEIPFDYENNFIILTLYFNARLPVRMIFDTGAEHTILTKREIAETLGLEYEREFKIIGSDMKTELVAYLSRRLRLDFPSKLAAPRADILVLKEDYFHFEEYAGVEVHGILSAHVFSKFFIRINYQRKTITLYDREHAPAFLFNGFEPLPVELFRQKLYLTTRLEVQRDSVAEVKLLIDTGAGLPLLLFTNTHPLLAPPQNALAGNIAMGLGGYLEGFRGRVKRLELGKFEQTGILTEYQKLDSLDERLHLNRRNGLIGNVLLNRFVVILDFVEEKIWLKPTKNYRDEFAADRSGLSLLVTGRGLTQFTVLSVLPNSPAAEAGILKGDRILRIGWAPAFVMSLTDVLRRLEADPGKKVRVLLKRDGKRLRRTVVLRDLI